MPIRRRANRNPHVSRLSTRESIPARFRRNFIIHHHNPDLPRPPP
ncbi:hypothetical protein GDI0853 [Gluconacetobacter diazotrophicus PA1 5]|uniref:Uncharacterized protein n=1 Tax=Gluconacetobacter diazotrophicus (strain ATCC 49037 / DSM 5601 / CCUG 37298 / CIP 103539 / LMG 7603 / PAl5) TaxID=272568 RepID=A9HBC3_GLUDA|nr:hypothetical protein GDI0853 [Gluconacetobacter diazotrophicus PA1 5]